MTTCGMLGVAVVSGHLVVPECLVMIVACLVLVVVLLVVYQKRSCHGFFGVSERHGGGKVPVANVSLRLT